MSAAIVTLTFPAKPDYLVLSRLALSGLARVYPVDPDVLADLKLAITEACGNAVRHAYEEEADQGPVSVSFHVDGDALDTAVASAKVVAADAAMANARACIQVHGGMGFTWEMMPHYLLKRTWVLEHSFGTTDRLTESIAAALGSPKS